MRYSMLELNDRTNELAQLVRRTNKLVQLACLLEMATSAIAGNDERKPKQTSIEYLIDRVEQLKQLLNEDYETQHETVAHSSLS